jgi:plastocyanin
MRSTLIKYLWAIAAFAPLLAATAGADVLLDETNLVGLPGVAQPSEFSFTASNAQALTVTLTDFQQPAAFTSLQIAVTLDDAVVGTPASVDATTHKATVAVPAAAGNYVLHVIGTPAIVSPNTQGFGSFGVCVAPASNPTSCIAADSYSGNIQTPAVVSTAGTSTLNTNFTSTVAGTYTVTLTDDAFPVALQTVSAGILQGATPVQVNIPAGTPTQVTLAAGTTYSLLVAAIANTTVQAGLYGIKVADPTGATVFNRTLPVGTLPASTIVDNTSAQGLSLVLTDFAYPTALASVGVAITEGSTSLAQLTASGSLSNFIAPAGSVEIWQYAVAGAQPGVYSVGLSSSSASLFSLTKVVNPAATTGQSYAFAVSLPSAGTYNLVTSDFQFPSSLQSISATVAQNGTVLPQTSGNFTAAAGYVVVVVNAVPPQSGNGIFGVTVQTSGSSPTIYLDQTQAVGGVFSTNTINLGTSGGYDVTLTDLAFPATFQNLALVLSRGSQVLGKIYGGGTFSIAGTPGKYVLTFVATPNSTGAASTQNYGLYSIRMASSPPTVVFTAGASSVTAGQTVTLTWSSTNATSCTAGGSSAWTGSKTTSGTLAVIVSATATLTLTCTGDGGSAAQSVTVTATAAAAKSSGGGGAVDWWLLGMLGVWTWVRRTVMRPSAASA